MASGEEFKEDCGIDGEVSTDADGPERSKASDSCEIGGSSGNETEDSSDTNGHIEGESSAEDVAAEAPEYCADQKSDVLGQR